MGTNDMGCCSPTQAPMNGAASMPKHLQMAREVANELINSFNGAEQFQFIEEVKHRLSNDYNSKIEELEIQLKKQRINLSDFVGETAVVGKGH